MVDHVIEIEGPIYFDVLIDRIARAHGFQRSGENVQRIIRAALGRQRFLATRDGDREVIWPQNARPCMKMPYRWAGGRGDHSDVPPPNWRCRILRSCGDWRTGRISFGASMNILSWPARDLHAAALRGGNRVR